MVLSRSHRVSSWVSRAFERVATRRRETTRARSVARADDARKTTRDVTRRRSTMATTAMAATATATATTRATTSMNARARRAMTSFGRATTTTATATATPDATTTTTTAFLNFGGEQGRRGRDDGRDAVRVRGLRVRVPGRRL